MIDLPDTLPVMVLPDCSLFPGARMPLFIFEPHYQEMLADVLGGGRMFCIGTADMDLPEEPDGPVVYPYSTAGLVRACVDDDDGTSNLVLEGLQRVQFIGWEEGESYRQAQVRGLKSVKGDPEESALLCGQIQDLAGQRMANSGGPMADPATVEALWVSLGSEEAIADFVAYHLIPDIHLRQPLLAMTSVEERLAFIRECLLQ